MGRIKDKLQYPIKGYPDNNDYVVGTDSESGGATVSFRLGDLFIQTGGEGLLPKDGFDGTAQDIINLIPTATSQLTNNGSFGGQPYVEQDSLDLLQAQVAALQSIILGEGVDLALIEELVIAIQNIQTYLDTILVNDLVTGGTTKALTAEQGVVLNGLITDINLEFENKVDKVVGERLINADEIQKLSDLSGVNTGDQDLLSYQTLNEKGQANGYVPLSNLIKVPSEYLTIVNNLTAGGATSILSAEQGRQIKILIDNINSLLASDNQDLNTLQEIVDAIEQLQQYFTQLIVNDLVTGGTTKALSAEQGVVLKGLIDSLSTDIQTALSFKENAFLKNTAFNKNFGTTAGTVADGSHVSDTNNPHSVTKQQVGLGNVDNTSDLDKPVSTPTQAELDLKLDKGIYGGTAVELDTRISQLEATQIFQNRFVGKSYAIWSGTGLTYDVYFTDYYIDNVLYLGGYTQVTLPTSDLVNPRFDIIKADASGIIVGVGTPSENPEIPSIDPNTELAISPVLIGAGATVPVGESIEDIYKENVEWTTASNNGTVNFNATTNPFQGTKHVDCGAFSSGQYLRFTDNVTNQIPDYSLLKFYINLKASFSNNTKVSIRFYNGSTLISSTVAVSNGLYNFDRTKVNTYQTIIIPITDFTFTGSTFNRVEVVTIGSNTSGFRLDNITLSQGLINNYNTGTVPSLQDVTDVNPRTTNPISVRSIDGQNGISIHSFAVSMWKWVNGVSSYVNIMIDNITVPYHAQLPNKLGGADETFAMLSDLDTKVDKLTGYSLTQNDLTNALKALYDDAVTWISTNGANLINHLARTDNPHGVTKSQVGLGNVDNTSDINKPVSTLQAAADVSTLTNAQSYADGLITQLINGAPNDSNTLKELSDKIIAVQEIIGGTTADGDAIVNTVTELLAVFATFPEGVDLVTLLAGKVNTTDVYNALDCIIAGKVLDARQGKVLNDLISTLRTDLTANTTAIGLRELSSNKSQDVETDKASTTKFGSVKAFYDWCVGRFQPKLTAGTNVTIDNTNPLAPVISATASSGGGGMSGLSVRNISNVQQFISDFIQIGGDVTFDEVNKRFTFNSVSTGVINQFTVEQRFSANGVKIGTNTDSIINNLKIYQSQQGNPNIYDFIAYGSQTSNGWLSQMRFFTAYGSNTLIEALKLEWNKATFGVPLTVTGNLTVNGSMSTTGSLTLAALSLTGGGTDVLSFTGGSIKRIGSNPMYLEHKTNNGAGGGWGSGQKFYCKNGVSVDELFIEIIMNSANVKKTYLYGDVRPEKLDLGALGLYVDDARASAGGVAVGFAYINSSTGAVHRRLT